jgi:hypothetical protein
MTHFLLIFYIINGIRFKLSLTKLIYSLNKFCRINILFYLIINSILIISHVQVSKSCSFHGSKQKKRQE